MPSFTDSQSSKEINPISPQRIGGISPFKYTYYSSGQIVLYEGDTKMELLSKEAKYAKGCRKQFPKKTVLQYPCCKKRKDKEVDTEEKSCDDEFHGGCQERYICCQKKKDSDPCVSKYECCEQPPNSEGCATVWKCCEETEDHKGCKERYQCCQMPEDARGCEDKWECCGQAPEEKGCQTVCDRCNIRWGHKPGCSWPENEDDAKEKSPDLDDGMNTNDYDEEHNPAIAEDIAQERMDAIEQELSPVPPMGDVPNGIKRAISTDLPTNELL